MITQALVSNGAKVYITGRREDKLENAIKQYSTGPGEILPLAGDISNKDDIKRLVKEIEQKEPKGIQLLVNNAGIARDDNTKFGKLYQDLHPIRVADGGMQHQTVSQKCQTQSPFPSTS